MKGLSECRLKKEWHPSINFNPLRLLKHKLNKINKIIKLIGSMNIVGQTLKFFFWLKNMLKLNKIIQGTLTGKRKTENKGCMGKQPAKENVPWDSILCSNMWTSLVWTNVHEPISILLQFLHQRSRLGLEVSVILAPVVSKSSWF